MIKMRDQQHHSYWACQCCSSCETYCSVVISTTRAVQTIAMSMSVCLSVRLFVCMSARITRKLRQFLCTLPALAMARPSSDGVAIHCVFPVLRMTLCFHTMGPMGQNQARHYVYKKFARWRHQLDVKTTTAID